MKQHNATALVLLLGLLAMLALPAAAQQVVSESENGAPGKDGFLLQSFSLLDEQGNPVSHVQPGEPFTVKVEFRAAEESKTHGFGELALWHGDDLLAVSGQRIPLEQGRGSVAAEFTAPKDARELSVEAAVDIQRPADILGSTTILVGDRLSRYEPQRMLVRKSGQLEMMSGQHFDVQEHALVFQHFHGVKEGIREIAFDEIMVGAHDVVLSTLQGQVVQIDVLAPQYVDFIRVGLTTEDFSSLDHSRAVLSSSTGLLVKDYRNQVMVRSSPGLPLEFHVEDGSLIVHQNDREVLRTDERLFIHPADGGMIRVESFKRGGSHSFHPEYRGFMELTASGPSVLQIINEVEMDEYLYGVVPSEMPPRWPMEALKAQAVASRTYAVRSALHSSYSHRGFHVQDSTMSQVYNNRREAGKTNTAVSETAPMLMSTLYEQEVIQAVYHSSSAGVTARASQVWSSADHSFPGPDRPYLQARSIIPGFSLPEQWTEDEAHDFFTDESLQGYDAVSPWFRWQVRLTAEELTAAVNASLYDRWQAQSEFVLTRREDGSFASKPIPEEGIGRIRHLEVAKRGEGGQVMALDIYGEDAVVQIQKELNIRFVIRPSQAFTGSDITIQRLGSGTDLVNYSLLPSAFMSFSLEHGDNGSLESVTFYGGGSGHGVGMSQWAAKAMAEEGMDYRTILRQFYEDIQFTPIQMEYR